MRLLGPLAAGLMLGACATREAAEDFLDDLRDASFELPDTGLGRLDSGADDDGGQSAWDSSQSDGATDGDGSIDADTDAGSGEAGLDVEVPTSYCGDGVVASDENCDTSIAAGSPGACPTSCAEPGNACERVMPTGSGCAVRCEQTTIAACTNDDGCCANGCTLSNDNDCTAVCGNAVTETGELCDGNCPASCDDSNACTTDSATGAAGTCDRACAHTAITTCKNGDGCCAPGCNNANDNDCSASCGNGTREGSELCDGNCPTTCNDNNACTTDVLSGTAGQCNVKCTSTPKTTCANGDGCCPSGCFANNDNDCQADCGNDVVEPGEECEPSMTNDPNCSADCLLPQTVCLNRAEENGEDRDDVCVQCGCNECASQLKACYEATDVAAGGPAAGTSRATLCRAVVECGRESGCTGQACYCGTASLLQCLSSPNGPCRNEIAAAAESTSALTIRDRQSNTNYAIGRANAVSECTVDNCSAECNL